MTELEKKVLALLKEKPMKMQEIADSCGMDKSSLYQGTLKHLLGEGKIQKKYMGSVTLYELSFNNINTRATCLDNYSINDISLDKEQCLNTNTVLGVKNSVKSKEQCLNTNTMLDTNTDTGVLRGNQYPTDPEEVVIAAKEGGYIMSLKEAAKFFAVYAAIGWIDRNGFPIRSWRALLPVWQLNQTPEQLANARKEHERRKQGLPTIDPEEKEWEYYTDAQGRKWRKRPDESEWEHVPELITFADGLISEKGVL